MAMSKQEAPLNSGCLTGAESSNPLLNNVVLQTLFEHASLADLKNWRKVCKLWLEVSLPRWRREVWVKVIDYEEIEEEHLFLGKYLDLMPDEEGALEGDLYQFRKYPFRRFKFGDLGFGFETPKNDDTRQDEFLDKCGTQVTHLEFKRCSAYTFPSLFSIICRSLPNLETLRLLRNWYHFHQESNDSAAWESDLGAGTPALKALTELKIDFSGGYERNYSYCVRGWTRFGQLAPNLKSLILTNCGDQLEVILLGMMPPDAAVDVGWKVEKLDMLQIDSMDLRSFEQTGMVDSLLNQFCQLRFPLTELSLDIGRETSDVAYKQILETYAVTLRKLVVYRAESGSVFGVESAQHFPFDVNLHALSELWLVGGAMPRNLHFLRLIPNLKRLLLIGNIGKSLLAAGSYLCHQKTLENLFNGRKWNESDFNAQNSVIADTDFRRMEDLVCSQLEEFVVSGTEHGYCNPKHVAALAKLMPNLKRVMLGLANDGFRVVCDTSWKKLEALVVQPYAIDEFGITGIVPGITSHSRFPNITDLKSLRYFGMGFESSTHVKVALSDDSFVNGIAELPNLWGLTVVFANEMSGEVLAQLMARFPNGKIHNEGHDHYEWMLDVLDGQADETRFNGVSSDDERMSEDESSSGGSDDDVNENEDRVLAFDEDSD